MGKHSIERFDFVRSFFVYRPKSPRHDYMRRHLAQHRASDELNMSTGPRRRSYSERSKFL